MNTVYQLSRFSSYCSKVFRKTLLKPSNKHRLYCAQAAKLEVPTPDGEPKTYPPHITDIVDKISKLTLLEVSELNSCLKTTLNIQEAPMMPMGMPMGGMAAAPKEEEEANNQPVQTVFTVKLEKFDETKKIALIKEVKRLVEGMNLVQAKKFVESAPTVVKEDVNKEEAEELKKALEAAGATVEVS